MDARFAAFDTVAGLGGVIAFAGQQDGALALPKPTAALDKMARKRISAAAAAAGFTGAAGKTLVVFAPTDGIAMVALAGVGDLAKASGEAVEKAAAAGFKALSGVAKGVVGITLAGWKKLDSPAVAARAAFGAVLASYRFERYRTTMKPEQKQTITGIVVDVAGGAEPWEQTGAVARAVSFARDLVNEPANVLYPEAFAARLKALEDLGVAVQVLGEAEMAALGMHSLLGVGLGSERESQLVVMSWTGGEPGAAPLALVGKGVCFDTGGISLKPAGGMEEMKGDMGGAAAVSGAMMALAGRKAKANIVGVVALVENMPDGKAQRPGDIVTSMSGQTIEVLNTDAEGRLVLCDAMTYVQEKHAPAAMIDLATLTGAIIISLGSEHAGLFSNSDGLSDKITRAGAASGEPVWRLPLGPAYDRLLDSPVADMKNVQRSGPGAGAGSITAAQFLGRFVKSGVDWAHIDIAGTAWKTSNTDPREPSWATGYGVRLLNQLVADSFEG